jgi:hypothetical protein
MKHRILLKSGFIIFILFIGMLVYAYLRSQETGSVETVEATHGVFLETYTYT